MWRKVYCVEHKSGIQMNAVLHLQHSYFFEKMEEVAQKCAKAAGKGDMLWGDENLKMEGTFCRTFLRTMDPDLAAAEIGRADGFSSLERQTTQDQLERMRISAANQIRREDVIRRLAQLAFGRANDAVKLALDPTEADPENMELAAVSEFKVTDKGVEVKLIDRVRALETLHALLENSGGDGAEELYRALEDAAGQPEGGWDYG